MAVLGGDEHHLALGTRLVCVWLHLRRRGGVGRARDGDRVERATELPGGEALLRAHVPQLRGAVTRARYTASNQARQSGSTHKQRCGLAQSGHSPASGVSGVHSSPESFALVRPTRDP